MRDRFPEIFQLPFEEKFQFAQELWNDIAEHHADEIPIPEWVWEEVERRRAKHLEDPSSGLTWEEVEASIRSRHGLQPDDLSNAEGYEAGSYHLPHTSPPEERPMRARFPEIFQLPVAEKLQLVQELWDDIAADPEEIPIPEWQLQELARREANYLKDPTAGSSWEEVKERIRSRHARNTDHPA